MEKREKEEEDERIEEERNWSERVEDLVVAGDTGEAISLLESLVSKFETRLDSPSSDGEAKTVIELQLASALTELAKLYASQGFSLKSDELHVRSCLVKQRALESPSPSDSAVLKKVSEENQDSMRNDASDRLELDGNVSATDGHPEISSRTNVDNMPLEASSDDDWEAFADRDPSELLPLDALPDVSSLSIVEPTVQGPKRRGRGTFTYTRNELNNDRDQNETLTRDAEDHDQSHGSEKKAEPVKSKHGTRHVLLVAGFSPSMRTTDLEKLFEDFKDSGFVIRWVNDTTALAVFRTPSAALEACNRVRCSFTVRVLNDDDDALLGSISARDLEPPSQRPKTSARTAQRLIAHGMGLKLPSSAFGSKELRKQEEEARRNRIVTRQKQREDAWGDD